ncbi:unnamed protein product [Amoebophrya sp. A120]|nr:unnamed protein product [Amoebophrya sp. A120]|eukprot:GSA120T00013595001.1
MSGAGHNPSTLNSTSLVGSDGYNEKQYTALREPRGDGSELLPLDYFRNSTASVTCPVYAYYKYQPQVAEVCLHCPRIVRLWQDKKDDPNARQQASKLLGVSEAALEKKGVPAGMICREGGLKLCRAGYYCPDVGTELQAPKGFYTRSGWTEPRECIGPTWLRDCHTNYREPPWQERGTFFSAFFAEPVIVENYSNLPTKLKTTKGYSAPEIHDELFWLLAVFIFLMGVFSIFCLQTFREYVMSGKLPRSWEQIKKAYLPGGSHKRSGKRRDKQFQRRRDRLKAFVSDHDKNFTEGDAEDDEVYHLRDLEEELLHMLGYELKEENLLVETGLLQHNQGHQHLVSTVVDDPSHVGGRSVKNKIKKPSGDVKGEQATGEELVLQDNYSSSALPPGSFSVTKRAEGSAVVEAGDNILLDGVVVEDNDLSFHSGEEGEEEEDEEQCQQDRETSDQHDVVQFMPSSSRSKNPKAEGEQAALSTTSSKQGNISVISAKSRAMQVQQKQQAARAAAGTVSVSMNPNATVASVAAGGTFPKKVRLINEVDVEKQPSRLRHEEGVELQPVRTTSSKPSMSSPRTEISKPVPVDVGAHSSDEEPVVPPALRITFEDLDFTVGPKAVLKSVKGSFAPGSLVAVMGASGAGKTSFVNVVANKLQSYANAGQLRIDGQIRLGLVEDGCQQFPSEVGYVPQDNVMFDELSVWANLYFAAKLRMPKGTEDHKIRKTVDNVLKILEIDHVRNSLVGGVEQRGISGGEKKRVSIGMELVALPRVLFLDEPTSGLDAAASMNVCRCLRRLRKFNVTTVCVIHQPRQSAFLLFDQLLLLAKGQVVYLGSPFGAIEYFIRLGFPFTTGENAADWVLDVLEGLHTCRFDDKGNRAIDYAAEQSGNNDNGARGAPGTKKSLKVIISEAISDHWRLRESKHRFGDATLTELETLERIASYFLPRENRSTAVAAARDVGLSSAQQGNKQLDHQQRHQQSHQDIDYINKRSQRSNQPLSTAGVAFRAAGSSQKPPRGHREGKTQNHDQHLLSDQRLTRAATLEDEDYDDALFQTTPPVMPNRKMSSAEMAAMFLSKSNSKSTLLKLANASPLHQHPEGERRSGGPTTVEQNYDSSDPETRTTTSADIIPRSGRSTTTTTTTSYRTKGVTSTVRLALAQQTAKGRLSRSTSTPGRNRMTSTSRMLTTPNARLMFLGGSTSQEPRQMFSRGRSTRKSNYDRRTTHLAPPLPESRLFFNGEEYEKWQELEILFRILFNVDEEEEEDEGLGSESNSYTEEEQDNQEQPGGGARFRTHVVRSRIDPDHELESLQSTSSAISSSRGFVSTATINKPGPRGRHDKLPKRFWNSALIALSVEDVQDVLEDVLSRPISHKLVRELLDSYEAEFAMKFPKALTQLDAATSGPRASSPSFGAHQIQIQTHTTVARRAEGSSGQAPTTAMDYLPEVQRGGPNYTDGSAATSRPTVASTGSENMSVGLPERGTGSQMNHDGGMMLPQNNKSVQIGLNGRATDSKNSTAGDVQSRGTNQAATIQPGRSNILRHFFSDGKSSIPSSAGAKTTWQGKLLTKAGTTSTTNMSGDSTSHFASSLLREPTRPSSINSGPGGQIQFVNNEEFVHPGSRGQKVEFLEQEHMNFPAQQEITRQNFRTRPPTTTYGVVHPPTNKSIMHHRCSLAALVYGLGQQMRQQNSGPGAGTVVGVGDYLALDAEERRGIWLRSQTMSDAERAQYESYGDGGLIQRIKPLLSNQLLILSLRALCQFRVPLFISNIVLATVAGMLTGIFTGGGEELFYTPWPTMMIGPVLLFQLLVSAASLEVFCYEKTPVAREIPQISALAYALARMGIPCVPLLWSYPFAFACMYWGFAVCDIFVTDAILVFAVFSYYVTGLAMWMTLCFENHQIGTMMGIVFPAFLSVMLGGTAGLLYPDMTPALQAVAFFAPSRWATMSWIAASVKNFPANWQRIAPLTVMLKVYGYEEDFQHRTPEEVFHRNLLIQFCLGTACRVFCYLCLLMLKNQVNTLQCLKMGWKYAKHLLISGHVQAARRASTPSI